MNQILKEYSDRQFSIIPVNKNSKDTNYYWRKNQFQRACDLDVLSWNRQGFNLGIVTGRISRLVVFDLDNLGSLEELQRQVPETKQTTKVETASGKFHYYFESNKYINSIGGNFLGIPGIERKAEGAYILCPNSTINNNSYRFIVPLAEILPYPPKLISEEQTAQRPTAQRFPQYYTNGMDCISQILEKELIPRTDLHRGERNDSLHILYRLFRKARNTKEYSKDLIAFKNQSLRYPLTQIELSYVWKKDYRIGCQEIRDCLNFVNCDGCRYNERGQKMFSLQVRNQSKLLTLTTTERSTIVLIDRFFDSEIPSPTQLAKRFNMNWGTAKKAIEGLKNKGIR
ncbi:hypothetical protein ES702_07793 [subsurface metagenome]